MKAKRRLKALDVQYISLVDKGANQKTVIWKAADAAVEPLKTVKLAKVDEEERLVYGIVYSPDEVDTQGDVTDAQVIKQAAYSFMKNLRLTKIDKQHDFDPDEGYIAESWLIRKGDPLFKSEKSGSWAVAIKIENDETWDAVKSGEISGLSLAGEAETESLEKIESDGLLDKFMQKMERFFGLNRLPLSKDFNNEFMRSQRDRAHWSLLESIDLVMMSDDDPATKKQKVMENIQQFKGFYENYDFDIQKKEGHKMTPEDVTKAVQDAVKPLEDRLEKLETAEPASGDETKETDKGVAADEVTQAVRDALKPVEDRLEKLEKASPGSSQDRGQDVEKNEQKKGLKIV